MSSVPRLSQRFALLLILMMSEQYDVIQIEIIADLLSQSSGWDESDITFALIESLRENEVYMPASKIKLILEEYNMLPSTERFSPRFDHLFFVRKFLV